MHVVFEQTITREIDLRSAVEARGWFPHEIDLDRYHDSVAEIDKDLLKAGLKPETNVPTIVFGSTGLIRSAARRGHMKVASGCIAEERTLRWSGYASHLPKEWLLNGFGVMFPWGFLARDETFSLLRQTFGKDGVFVRPDSPGFVAQTRGEGFISRIQRGSRSA